MKIPPPMIAEMLAHARDAYPSEACGIITGTPDALTRLTRCTNVQDRLHAEDPMSYPRTSRDGYNVDSREMFEVLRDARARGEDYRIVYHSHVDAGPYFSAEDRRVATWEGEPVYPGVAYIVVSVLNGEAVEANLFTWSEERRDFEGTPLEIS